MAQVGGDSGPKQEGQGIGSLVERGIQGGAWIPAAGFSPVLGHSHCSLWPWMGEWARKGWEGATGTARLARPSAARSREHCKSCFRHGLDPAVLPAALEETLLLAGGRGGERSRALLREGGDPSRAAAQSWCWLRRQRQEELAGRGGASSLSQSDHTPRHLCSPCTRSREHTWDTESRPGTKWPDAWTGPGAGVAEEASWRRQGLKTGARVQILHLGKSTPLLQPAPPWA